MFSFSFFAWPTQQRLALLAADDFAPLPLLPETQLALQELEDPARGTEPSDTGSRALLIAAALSVKHIVLRSLLWRMVGSLLVLVGVFASTHLIDEGQQLSSALLFVGVFTLSKIVGGWIEYFDELRRAQVNRAVQAYLMRLVNRRLLELDPVSALQFSKGEFKTLVSSDVEAVEDFLSAAIQQWAPTLVVFLVLGPALLFTCGSAGVVALLGALLVLPLAWWGARGIEGFQSRAQKEQDSLTTLVGEWVRNIRLVRFLGWQPHFTAQMERVMRRFTLQYAGRHVIACIVYGVTWSWWMVPVTAMLVYASAANVPLTLVQLFSGLWILDQLMNYVQHLPYSLSLYGAAAASASRIGALLGAKRLSENLLPAPSTAVSLGVPVRIYVDELIVEIGGKRILDSISCVLDLNSQTAIVGEVGAGKSVLLEVLLGERAATRGRVDIEFDSGVRANLWRRDVYESFRRQVAFAAQQPFISNSQLRHNIDLSTVCQDNAVHTAALKGCLEPDIAAFPRGLAEEIGEVGINLSGGQKQRVSLARAFLSGRPVLMLDDPLSAVDGATEEALMDTIFANCRGFILVSHRLGELSRCARVLVLEKGRIVEDGDPKLLTAISHSHFSRFLRALEAHG